MSKKYYFARLFFYSRSGKTLILEKFPHNFLDLDPKMMYTKFQPYLTIFKGPIFFGGKSHNEVETGKMTKCHTRGT